MRGAGIVQASGPCLHRCALSGATECCLFRRREKPRFMTFLLTIISALKGLRMPRMRTTFLYWTEIFN